MGAMKLLSPESKSVMLELADGENRCVELYVYHLPVNQFNWEDGESSNENENEGNNVDNSEFVEGNNDDNDIFIEGNNDFNSGSENVLRDEDRDWSDEEFMEIRKNCREEILRINAYEKEANYENEGNGEDSDGLHSSEGYKYAFSSEESDEEVCYATPPLDVGKVKHVNEVFNVNTGGKDIKLKAGLLFSNKKALKDALRSSSMDSGRPYNYIENIDRWQIKTIVSEHNCVWNYKNKHVSVKFLVEQYGDRIRRNPNWKLVEMQDEFKRVLKVDVCEAKCSRVRQKALSGVEDKMKEHYEKVRRFAGEILHNNRNNTVKIRTTRLQDGDIPRFQRMKTLISDQQKGLDKAIRELLPQVEHRFCTRHLLSNLSKVYPSSLVSNAFWKASTDTHPKDFKRAFKELERASKGAWQKMNGLPPSAWSKAYFGTHSNTDSTENNISECFNSWILKARYMPLIDMLLDIHDMIMTRLHQNRDIMARRNCVIVPRIKKILDEAIKESVGYMVLWDGRDTYVVKGHGGSVSVNLKDRTCACRVWDLTGVPCCHAVTVIQESRQKPLDFVAKWFTKETYMRTYSNCLEVIRGEEFWEDVEGDTVHPPLIVKKLRGRPKTQRRREGLEGTVSKGNKTRVTYTGRKMHCGICRKEGHNKNVCPDKPADDQPQQPKQKRQRKNKKQGSDDPEKEVTDEIQRQGMEKSTGEDDLMNEATREVEEQTQGLDEVEHSIQIEQQIQTEPNKRMRFVSHFF
ncbi:hypothetical protein POM88_036505 [Heracleum sosnowskyi]|uniref:SWIM-type domain-containing protein n=1 Tax=Heracleum sosnowskyi TaxID=360622 RepID=A0AAD8MFQ9_9APIA|nr:hypothetical protein POM88_036505 [Heracleum sosnowskyi]